MTAPALTLATATDAHIDVIIAIEREAGGASVVTLTHGHALRQAMARGHDVIVALDSDAVAGWAWYSLDEDRSGDLTGQIYRVAVTSAARRNGTATRLLTHIRATLHDRGCARIRATIGARDSGALALFRAAGFSDEAVTLEAVL